MVGKTLVMASHRSPHRIPYLHRSLSLLLLVAISTAEFPNPTAQFQQNPPEASAPLIDLKNLMEQQEQHLQRLETLIETVKQSVDRLEASISSASPAKAGGKIEKDNVQETIETPTQILAEIDGKRRNRAVAEAGQAKGKGVTVAKYKPAWTERFQFLSAVKFETNVTCLNVLPQEDDEGVSKYVAVGDDQGRVYVFLSHGDVLVDFVTLSPSPVTAMLSYVSAARNETVLLTGHADGAVLLHRLWEMTGGGVSAGHGDDWHVLAMEHVRVLAPGGGISEGAVTALDSVTALEVHQVGKMRYVLAVNRAGRISVFRENGTLYGAADTVSRDGTVSRPLAFLRQRLLFLTETGAGSLDLRSMTVRRAECDGLNGSRVVTYAFDAAERSKAYGFTAEGDLIHVLLLGDVLNFECRVRAKRKSEIDGPLVVQSIKGYLMVGTPEKVYVYNTTTQPYIRVGGPRPLFYAFLDEIISAFARAPVAAAAGKGRREPLIACNKDRLVVLGLGDGYVGMYKSNLPVYKAEFNTMLWSSPVLVFVLFLVGAWQFFGKRREAFTILGSEDPFASMPSDGRVAAAVPGDRGYDNPPRPEVRDLRESGLRGPTRRYVSPSRYPAGAISYRTNTVDPNYRASSESNYRTASSSPEPAGYQKRRDPRFSSTQVVEEKIQ